MITFEQSIFSQEIVIMLHTLHIYGKFIMLSQYTQKHYCNEVTRIFIFMVTFIFCCYKLVIMQVNFMEKKSYSYHKSILVTMK